MGFAWPKTGEVENMNPTSMTQKTQIAHFDTLIRNSPSG
jgi:hypothetical protein